MHLFFDHEHGLLYLLNALLFVLIKFVLWVKVRVRVRARVWVRV